MKERFFTIVFVLVFGSFLTSLLVAVNHYTAPIIEKNKEAKIKSSVLNAFDVAHTRGDLEKVFSDNVKAVDESGKIFYFSSSEEIAFEIYGPGLWGPIEAVIALKPDLKTIKGITIVHQEETPGLGGRIAEVEYLAGFKGKKIFPALEIVAPGTAKQENQIDGITGATMTSEAFEKLINDQVKKYLSIIEGKEE